MRYTHQCTEIGYFGCGKPKTNAHTELLCQRTTTIATARTSTTNIPNMNKGSVIVYYYYYCYNFRSFIQHTQESMYVQQQQQQQL